LEHHDKTEIMIVRCIEPMLGNDSVNTFQKTRNNGSCVLCGPCYSSVLGSTTILTTEEVKKAVFWDVSPCRSGVNQRFGGTYRLHLQGRGEIRKSAREASIRDVKSSLLLMSSP
jgi:hypothetical protein